MPSSLLIPPFGDRAGVRDVIAVCPRPEPVVMAAALEAGGPTVRIGGAHASQRGRTAPHRCPAGQIVGPGNRYVSAAKAWSTGLRNRLLRRTDGNPHRRKRGRADDRGGSHRTSEHDPDARAC